MKPLESITILEFSTMITASLASMMMAEQGARVIKVEPMAMGTRCVTSVREKPTYRPYSLTVIAARNHSGST